MDPNRLGEARGDRYEDRRGRHVRSHRRRHRDDQHEREAEQRQWQLPECVQVSARLTCQPGRLTGIGERESAA